MNISVKNKIIELNEIFIKVKALNVQSDTEIENENYFKQLESYVQLYKEKLKSIEQGCSFYSEFDSRISSIANFINDYLMARDLEKNDMIEAITRGENIQLAQSTNPNQPISYLDPNQNYFTNMNVYYRQSGGKGGYY